jgi:quercetin dioxygenase-like cupin family protein
MIVQRSRELVAWCVAGGALLLAWATLAADDPAPAKYTFSGKGTRWLESTSGAKIKMLVEQSNLAGTEVEIGEISFPAGYGKSLPHGHGHVEIFYVLSGKLGHTVKGEKHVIEPGMVGIVRPGDAVVHSVESDEEVKALVIWAPGGEAETLIKARIFKPRPIEE